MPKLPFSLPESNRLCHTMHELTLKLLLIYANSHLSQIAASPPQRTATKEEQGKYVKGGNPPDFLSRVTRWYFPTFSIFMQSFQVLEILAILSVKFPPIYPSWLPTHGALFPRDKITAIGITPTFVIGTLLVWAGSSIRIACYRRLGRQFTFELSLQEDHKLVTDGLYAYVRHPSYLGTFIWLPGLLLCQMGSRSWMAECELWETAFGRFLGVTWLYFVASLLIAIVLRTDAEDAVLRNEFKSQWTSWSKQTPYKILPFIY